MKATQAQYDVAVTIYENSKEPVSNIFTFAEWIGVNEFSVCEPCELATPDAETEDGTTICLVCGSARE